MTNTTEPLLTPEYLLAFENEITALKMGGNMYGSEGFTDVALRLLTGVADFVSRLFSTYKLVYRSFRDLKRTEIDSYHEKYLATYGRVKRLNFTAINEVQIPLPRNLQVTYLVATNQLLVCLKMCDMVNRSKSFMSTTKTIEGLLRDGGSATSSLTLMYGQQGDIKNLELVHAAAEKCFGSKSSTTGEFGKFFSNMTDFDTVGNLLIAGSQYEYDTGKVYSNLQTCEENMRSSLAHAKARKSNGIPLSKTELIALSDGCVFMAKTFDLFGVTVQDFNKVEHNYVETCKLLARKFKL